MRKTELEVGKSYALSNVYGDRSPSRLSDVTKVKVLDLSAEKPNQASWSKGGPRGIEVEVEDGGGRWYADVGERRVISTAKKFFGDWDETKAMFERFDRERAKQAKAQSEYDAREQRNLERLDIIQQNLGYAPARSGASSSLVGRSYDGKELRLNRNFITAEVARLVQRAYVAGAKDGQDGLGSNPGEVGSAIRHFEIGLEDD